MDGDCVWWTGVESKGKLNFLLLSMVGRCHIR
jgi:hypothetical protein